MTCPMVKHEISKRAKTAKPSHDQLQQPQHIVQQNLSNGLISQPAQQLIIGQNVTHVTAADNKVPTKDTVTETVATTAASSSSAASVAAGDNRDKDEGEELAKTLSKEKRQQHEENRAPHEGLPSIIEEKSEKSSRQTESPVEAVPAVAAVVGTCSTVDACANVALNITRQLLDQHRCDYIEKSLTNPGQRMIQLTHIPKSGGTSIDRYLRALNGGGRYDGTRYEHESYGSAELNTAHRRLFSVVIRHPATRAISLYNYVRSFPGTNNNKPVWHFTNTHRNISLLDWAAAPTVAQALLQTTREIFDPTEKNSPFNARLKETHKIPLAVEAQQATLTDIKDTFPVSLESFMAQINSQIADPKLQCIDTMTTALLLIKRYSVVSTMENMAHFWRVLSARAALHMSSQTIKDATEYHINKAPRRFSSKDHEIVVARRLTALLHCDVLLHRIAGMIAEHDLTCPLVHSDTKRRHQESNSNTKATKEHSSKSNSHKNSHKASSVKTKAAATTGSAAAAAAAHGQSYSNSDSTSSANGQHSNPFRSAQTNSRSTQPVARSVGTETNTEKTHRRSLADGEVVKVYRANELTAEKAAVVDEVDTAILPVAAADAAAGSIGVSGSTGFTSSTSSAVNSTSDGCTSFEACSELLLTYTHKLIDQYRCSYIEQIVTESDKRLIQFIHIPKAGGTSVDRKLQGLSGRYDKSRAGHETHGSAEFNTNHRRLFCVVIRHPVERAFSLYSYIRTIGGTNHNKTQWIYTNSGNVTLTQWAQEPLIINFLAQFGGIFNTTLVDWPANAELKARKLRSNTTVMVPDEKVMTPVEDTFPVSEEKYADDVRSLVANEDFQCLSDMKIALLLIKRYSAVTQLDHMKKFWTVLSARAVLKLSDMSLAVMAKEHLNIGNYRPEVKTEQGTVYGVLEKTLRCDILLWKIAGIRNEDFCFIFFLLFKLGCSVCPRLVLCPLRTAQLLVFISVLTLCLWVVVFVPSGDTGQIADKDLTCPMVKQDVENRAAAAPKPRPKPEPYPEHSSQVISSPPVDS